METDATSAAGLSDARRALLKGYLRGGMAGGMKRPAAIPKRSGSGPAPLSYGQRQIWLDSHLAGDALIYNEPVTIHRHSDLDISALERSFAEILRRHEAWRTTFEWSGDQPVQIVHPAPLQIEIPFTDLRSHPRPLREREAIRLAESDAFRAFDLAQGPLYRLRLVRLDDFEHRLFLTLHHIIFDGVSLYQVFLPELQKLYRAFTTNECNESPALPELPIQYSDYAVWQREAVRRILPAQLSYWKTVLDDAPMLDLQTDRPRPFVRTYAGAMETLEIPAPVTAALKALSREQGTTFFMTIVAAFIALLHGYTGQEDIVIGTATDGRGQVETAGLMGFLLNTVALRCAFSKNHRFTELLARVKQAVLGALSHDAIPFELLLQNLARKRDSSRRPLVEVMISVEPPLAPLKDGWAFTQMDVEMGTAKLDLQLELDDRAEGLIGRFIYNTALFERKTIEALKSRWLALLDRIAAKPEARLDELAQLTEAQRREILFGWNDTKRDYPVGSLHGLIEAQAARTPDAVAVAFEQQTISYRDLNRRANQMAHRLRSLGVGPDVIVALAAERSIEMVIGLLAILKAGGAYLPLDVSHPPERLAFMLADARPRALLTQRAVLARLPDGDTIRIFLEDDFSAESGLNPPSDARPDHLAYVIYTSGSTGHPKGVMNTHRGIVNRLLWMQETYGLGAEDRILQKTTCAFDVSVWEFFWPLLAGARLVMARPGGQGDTAYLADAIRMHGITTLHFVPSMLAVFLDDPNAGRCASLRRVICSGEALPFELQERFFSVLPGVELHNLYGPTEAAVDVTFWRCQPGAADRIVPIGRPIANTSIHILDDALRPLPAGAIGELMIGGVQVARGYLGRPELTAEKFIPNPYGEGRLYKTGDLARYRADGVIEYIGRLDQQVKLRGFRIELGEIEDALRKHPGIRAAAVVLREDAGEKRLAAYCVPRSAAAVETPGAIRQTIASVAASLRATLPDYMAPSAFVFLDRLPLSANGKLDRRALPAPDWEKHPAGSEFVAPRNGMEENIASVWRQVLKVERIGVHDDFFELGGHSLAAMQVVNRLSGSLSLSLNVLQIFEHPTIASLAEAIGRRSSAAADAGEIEEGAL